MSNVSFKEGALHSWWVNDREVSIRAALWLKSCHNLMVYFQFPRCSPGDADPLMTPFRMEGGWLAGTHQWGGTAHLSRAGNCLYYRHSDGAEGSSKLLIWGSWCCYYSEPREAGASSCSAVNAPAAWPHTRAGGLNLQKSSLSLFHVIQIQHKIICKPALH